jgi:signal transduction histidine kinase
MLNPKTVAKGFLGTSFFRERLLRHFFFISLAIAIAIPMYHVLFIHSLFDRLLIEDKREDAVSIAKHLASEIKLVDGDLETASFPLGLLTEQAAIQTDFGLAKLKLYSKRGKLIFSTEAGEIGEIHRGDHFHEALEKGEVYTRVVDKGMKLLDGKTMHLDLVETFVPLMKDREFIGAFEIYYDISQRKDQLSALLLRSLGLLAGLAACFMAVISAALYKGNKSILEQRRAEKALQDAHDTLESKVQERTLELQSANERLKLEAEELNRAEIRVAESKSILQSLFDAISEPLFMLDEDLRIKILNEAALRYYRIDDYQEAIGKSCSEVVSALTPFSPCDRCAVCKNHLSGYEKMVFERRGIFDPSRIEQVSVYQVKGMPRLSKSCVIRISDITEQKKLERQMIRADRLASLGQLSGGIAHEIRSPLSGIGLFVDVLCDEEKFDRTDSELEIFGEIKNNIEKINNIIRRILDFARGEDAGSVEIDLDDLVKETLKFWNANLRNKKIKLELLLAEDLPVVRGDRIGLEQVMNNLIQNGIEAMDDGGILTISTKNGRSSFYKNCRAVKIEVKDTGRGISPEQQSKIFNPFYSTKPTGTGLGLAISHRIIDRQGGVLCFESEPGKGTKFIVELCTTRRN